MSGFFAAIPDAWAIAAESLPKPWPEVCAACDLRYHVDQIVKPSPSASALPTFAALKARWGWGSGRVEALLYRVEAWADRDLPGRLAASFSLVEAVRARRPTSLSGRERDESGTGPGRERDSAPAGNAANTDTSGRERDESGTGPGRERDTRDQPTPARADSPRAFHTDTGPHSTDHEPPYPPEGEGAQEQETPLGPSESSTSASSTPEAARTGSASAPPPPTSTTPSNWLRRGGYGGRQAPTTGTATTPAPRTSQENPARSATPTRTPPSGATGAARGDATATTSRGTLASTATTATAASARAQTPPPAGTSPIQTGSPGPTARPTPAAASAIRPPAAPQAARAATPTTLPIPISTTQPPPGTTSTASPATTDPPTRTATASRWTPDHERVYLAWRTHHVNGRVECPEASRRFIRAAVKAWGADDVAAVLRWAHEAPDAAAAYLRGENADSRTYLAIENLLRSSLLPGRVEAAKTWEAAGRPEGLVVSSRPPQGGRQAPGQAWLEETARGAEWARRLDEKRGLHATG